MRGRGKAAKYSEEFEAAWKAYGRKEEKGAAFEAWKVATKTVGGHPQLLTLIFSALKWQGPLFLKEGWKFAPYFERYLKRRKWEDEPAPVGARAEIYCQTHQRAPQAPGATFFDSCPRCRHFKAASAKRESEVKRTDELLASMGELPAWTEAERAEAAQARAQLKKGAP